MRASVRIAMKMWLELGGTSGDLCGNALHFVVDQAVGYQDRCPAGLIRRAGKIAHPSARFCDDEHSGRSGPGAKAKCPEGIEPTAGHGTKIERSSAIATHTMRAQSELPIIMNVQIVGPLVNGESGGN